MTSAKALKKKIAKRSKQKKNIQVKNSIRLKQKHQPDGQVDGQMSGQVPLDVAAPAVVDYSEEE